MPGKIAAALLLMILRSVVLERKVKEADPLHHKVVKEKAKRERKERALSHPHPTPVLRERAAEGPVLLEDQSNNVVKIGKQTGAASGATSATSGTLHHASSTPRATAKAEILAFPTQERWQLAHAEQGQIRSSFSWTCSRTTSIIPPAGYAECGGATLASLLRGATLAEKSSFQTGFAKWPICKKVDGNQKDSVPLGLAIFPQILKTLSTSNTFSFVNGLQERRRGLWRAEQEANGRHSKTWTTSFS